METAAKRRLGDIFVDRGLITNEQLQEALDHQRETGTKLGEVLVELGFVTRVALAGVIVEQWDELKVTTRGRKNAEVQEQRAAVTSGPTVVETALRDRLEALTAQVADRDRRIAQQDATIAALIAQLGSSAAA
jgi:predicted aminopeptidase